MKEFYHDNYKTQVKHLKNGKNSCIHRLGELKSLKCPLLPKDIDRFSPIPTKTSMTVSKELKDKNPNIHVETRAWTATATTNKGQKHHTIRLQHTPQRPRNPNRMAPAQKQIHQPAGQTPQKLIHTSAPTHIWQRCQNTHWRKGSHSVNGVGRVQIHKQHETGNQGLI